ncbi:MAG: phage tail tape measure protein, partial [Desulfobacterales bacterium]|nr:phage tail tape measure protein [Desulfobacterales bacterium]
MTDQGFNTYFNLIDNFTAKFDGIMKRITSVTRDKYVVDFGVSDTSVKNSSDAVKKVMGDMEGLQDAFSQPLSLTVTDLISGNLAAIGRQLDILRAKAIIPVGLSTGAAAVGLAAGAVGVAAVGMGIAATIPAAADLEAAMVRVNKLIGMEGEAAKGVQKDMQDMMMATGLGLDQIAAAYETAGGAGIGGDLMAAGDMEGARKEISDFVRITLEASSAFGMTADATSSMLSGIANVYKPIGEETNDFLRSVGSGIDAVADATIASEEKILTAMSHASSAMAMFEQTDATVKGTIALSAALISTNMSGDAAGEAIKDFFNYAKTDAENKVSKSLGMKASEYQAMLKSDPMAIVEAVTAKYNAMSAEEQGAYSKFFGMTGGKIPQLSGSANFQAGLLKAQGVVNPAYESGTKMSESFGKSLAGTWTQLDKMRQTITVLAQVIGSAFLPGFNAVLGMINAILSPLAAFVRYVAELGAKIPGMDLVATAASILAVVTAVSALASFLGPVIAGLGLASKAMMILSMYGNIAGLAISTMAGTIGTIVGILGGPLTIILVLAAAVGYLLYKTGYLQKAWDKFKESAIGKDLIGGLVTGIAWVTDEFTKLFSWLDEQWSKGSEGAFGWLLSALDTVAGTFGWLFDKLDDAYESGALGKALKLSLTGLFPIVALVKSLMTIADYARKLLDGSNVVSDLLSAGSKAWDDISNGVQ